MRMSFSNLESKIQNPIKTFSSFLEFQCLKIFLISILLILNSSSILLANSNFDSTLANQLQLTLDTWRSQSGCVGVSAAVIVPGQDTWLGVSGMSNPVTNDSIRTDHLFWTPAITQMFVATVIFQLAGEGELTLDDSLHQWLPSFQYIDSTITIRQLLNHTSGIHNYYTDDDFWPTVDSNPDKYWTPEELLQQFLGPPVFPPGSDCGYSNTNYLLLGMIIEEATALDLQTELKNRIGDPLNLSNTYFAWSLDIHNRVAHPWYYYDPDNIKDDIIDLYKTSCWSAVWAQGNIISTAEDIAVWAKSLFEAKVINQESLNQMLTFVSGTSYGLGVRKMYMFNRELWGHAGSLGYITIVAYSSLDSVSIAILANDESMPIINTMTELFTNVFASKYPLLIFDTKSVCNLGEISHTSEPRDTTFFVLNKGGITDSVFASIGYYGTADSSALSVEPAAFELAPGDSQAITYKITPDSLEAKYYYTELKIDSKFSPITPSLSKPIHFTIIPTAVEENKVDSPLSFMLKQNYPNPFNPVTTISYTLPKSCNVTLTIFNLAGQEITTLVNKQQPAGEYEAIWNAVSLPSGVYVCRLQAGEFVQTRKLVLLR